MTEHIIPLITLIALELVLGIDNIIFISIVTEKLPLNQLNKLRYWGLGLAVAMRLILLTGISYIIKLNKALFDFLEIPISGKDLILIVGGLFLIYKSVKVLVALIAEGFHSEIPKGYIYCSMFFSLVVNLVQIKTQSFKNNLDGNG